MSKSSTADDSAIVDFRIEDQSDPVDIEFLETQIRREASASMGLYEEVELAIFERDGDKVVAGEWTRRDCCELVPSAGNFPSGTDLLWFHKRPRSN